MREDRRTEELGVDRGRASTSARTVDYDPRSEGAGTTMPMRSQHVDDKADCCHQGLIAGRQPRIWSQTTLPRPCRLAYSTVSR